VKDEIIWVEVVVDYWRYYPGICLGEIENDKNSVRIAGVPAGIRMEHLLNTGPES
jgi:hypothetical protein